MFFSKKQKSSLEKAVVLVEEAMELVYSHLRQVKEPGHMPTHVELEQLTQFEWVMFNNYDVVRHISEAMHERAQVELPRMHKDRYQRRHYID